jgi:imidazole glycerol-phosphate synthase subunit HisH
MPVTRPLSTVRPRVVVLDYGSGNLRSAERALAATGADVIVTDDLAVAENADGLVVPGVGAYAACMAGIEEAKAAPVIAARVEQGLPVLGICVGAQIMFEAGDEHGVATEGLGLLPGRVTRLPVRRVPHIGWNTVSPPAGSVLFAGFAPDTRCYFVHSFAAFASDVDPAWPGPNRDPARPAAAAAYPGRSGAAASQDARAGKPLVTTTEHEGVVFVAAVEAGPLSVTQFHPEKSGAAGAMLLRAWVATLGGSPQAASSGPAQPDAARPVTASEALPSGAPRGVATTTEDGERK